MMLTHIWLSRDRPKSADLKFGLGRAAAATLAAAQVLIVPIILLGGIFGGLFTPTEAGVVAAVVIFLIALLQREWTARGLLRVLDGAVERVLLVMFVLVNAQAISWGFAATNFGSNVVAGLQGLGGGRIGQLILINLLLLVIHTFIETGPSILIMTPLLLPAVTAAHIDPLLFGIVMVVNSTIGQAMPPVGVNIYIAAKIARSPVAPAVIKIVPYVLSSLVVLIITNAYVLAH